MKKPLLYTFRRCPYAIRARLALALCNIDANEIEVDLKNKPKELIMISSKATVPVLLLNSGQVIDESIDIVKWAISKSMPEDWVDLSSTDIHMGEQLIQQLHQSYIPALNRYKYTSRYDDVDISQERKICESYLNMLDQTISGSAYLFSSCSIYDILVFPFIRQLHIADNSLLDPNTYQSLCRWYFTWERHSFFIKIMQKR